MEAEAAQAIADAEQARERAVEARYRIAVLEAEAATADDWADLTPRQRVRVRCGVQSHFLGFDMEEELALSGVGRDTRSDVYQDRRHYVWDNRSDTVTLRDDRGRYVDNAHAPAGVRASGQRHPTGYGERGVLTIRRELMSVVPRRFPVRPLRPHDSASGPSRNIEANPKGNLI
ncbi:hypothetical protein ACFZAB_34165 [Streptomyces albogriseolus]|uniref:hypothetical protein n=1 Tax=Streptomyces albogriseolus TaxID=1887 RepID=UPI00224EB2D5|nr:hypothetical protein [Streptomyces viridodiastaticus]MCX4618020.1 hypothetical protein [Streptomyces viridodiastaticus]